MKKSALLILLCAAVVALVSFVPWPDDGARPEYIQPSQQRTGDSATGYAYLTTGDFLKSGFPYNFYIKMMGNDNNLLHRTGNNAHVDYGFNAVKNADSEDIVIPTCLTCHAQVYDGELIIGLGNPDLDFSHAGQQSAKLGLLKTWQLTSPAQYRQIKAMLTSLTTVNPQMETEVRGVNAADRLATLLVAHRDPQTLVWSNKALLPIPADVVPADVPAWWLLKKKNAMFYSGFGRGDFGKYMMLSNILTVSDSAEAREVDSHFGDVLAYIHSIQPPKYKGHIDTAVAAQGRLVFNSTCSGCHGTYGPGGAYPNLLVPGSIVRTDSLLYKSNQQDGQFVDWFNRSWFSQGEHPAHLYPSNGYVAPPLDGVWITAPYLHNGSVPTIEAVLNSRLRPKYWSRDFSKHVYDHDRLGWKYEQQAKPDGKKVYNTTLPGYGNYGHYFGDAMSDNERKAVLEYLKTL